MIVASLFAIAGIALLYFGAEGLVSGSASAAKRLGLTPLVIGLTVVAFGTSMPELVVNIGAALAGSGDLAVGNVVGSNISNIALILGISALIAPISVHLQVIRLDLPIVLGATLVAVAVIADGAITRWEGAALTLSLGAYVVFSLRAAKREPGPPVDITVASRPKAPRSAKMDGVFIVGGLVLLTVGARLLVKGAITIAQLAGMSEAVIGLTVVAVGTSLPELATSVVAALKGEGDISVGNIVGSNLYNLLGVLGITSLILPLSATGISAMDLGVMTLLTAGLLPLMRTGSRLDRWEGGLLVAVYAVYAAWLLA